MGSSQTGFAQGRASTPISPPANTLHQVIHAQPLPFVAEELGQWLSARERGNMVADAAAAALFFPQSSGAAVIDGLGCGAIPSPASRAILHPHAQKRASPREFVTATRQSGNVLRRPAVVARQRNLTARERAINNALATMCDRKFANPPPNQPTHPYNVIAGNAEPHSGEPASAGTHETDPSPAPEAKPKKASKGKRWLKRKPSDKKKLSLKVSANAHNSKKPFIALRNGVRFVNLSGAKGRLAIGVAPDADMLVEARIEAGLDVLVDATCDAKDHDSALWCAKQNIDCHALDAWECFLKPQLPMRTKLYALAKVLARNLVDGKHIYIHCGNGVHRSALVACMIFFALGKDLHRALLLLNKLNPKILEQLTLTRLERFFGLFNVMKKQHGDPLSHVLVKAKDGKGRGKGSPLEERPSSPNALGKLPCAHADDVYAKAEIVYIPQAHVAAAALPITPVPDDGAHEAEMTDSDRHHERYGPGGGSGHARTGAGAGAGAGSEAPFIYTNLDNRSPQITVPESCDVDGKFIDSSFPANEQSIGSILSMTLQKALPGGLRWMRPDEICNSLDPVDGSTEAVRGVLFMRADTEVTRQKSGISSVAGSSEYSDQYNANLTNDLYGSLLGLDKIDDDGAERIPSGKEAKSLFEQGTGAVTGRPALVKHATVLYDDEPDTEDEDEDVQGKEHDTASKSQPSFAVAEESEDEDEGGVCKSDADNPECNSLCAVRSMMGSAVSRDSRKDPLEEEPKASPVSSESRVVLSQYSTPTMKVALSVVVNHPELPGAVLHEYDPKRGLVQCRFSVDGRWCWVITDDRLPTTHDGQLVFSHTINQNEFGIALIEKCYAVLCGSYQHIFNVPFEDVLMDMSGMPIQTFNLQQAQKTISRSKVRVERAGNEDKDLRFTVREFRNHDLAEGEAFRFGHTQLWSAIEEATEHGAVTVCGKYTNAIRTHESTMHLAPAVSSQKAAANAQAAGAVVPPDIVPDRGYILTGNPTPNGTVSFGAPSFMVGGGRAGSQAGADAESSSVAGGQAQAQGTPRVLGSDGTGATPAADIVVPCETIGTVFTRLDICQAFPQRRYSTQRFEAAWSHGQNGGSPKYPTFRENPMYRVSAAGLPPGKPGKLDIWIGQLGLHTPAEGGKGGASGTGVANYLPAAIVVATFDRKKDVETDATMLSGHRRNIIALSEFKSVRNRAISIDVEPGAEIMVVPCTEFPGQNRRFYVNFAWVGEQANFSIVECLPVRHHLTFMNSSSVWNDTCAGGPPTAESFRDNPCFILKRNDSVIDPSKIDSNVSITIALNTLDYSSTSFTEPDMVTKPKKNDDEQTPRVRAPRSIAVAILKENPKATAGKISECVHLTSVGGVLSGKRLKDLPVPQKTLEWTTSLLVDKNAFPIYLVPYTKQMGQFGRFSLVVSSTTVMLDLSDTIDFKPVPIGTEQKSKSRKFANAPTPEPAKGRRSSRSAPMGRDQEPDEVASTTDRYKAAAEKREAKSNRRKMLLAGCSSVAQTGGDDGVAVVASHANHQAGSAGTAKQLIVVASDNNNSSGAFSGSSKLSQKHPPGRKEALVQGQLTLGKPSSMVDLQFEAKGVATRQPSKSARRNKPKAAVSTASSGQRGGLSASAGRRGKPKVAARSKDALYRRVVSSPKSDAIVQRTDSFRRSKPARYAGGAHTLAKSGSTLSATTTGTLRTLISARNQPAKGPHTRRVVRPK